MTELTVSEREKAVQRLLALADLCARASSGPVDREELMLAAIGAKDDAAVLMSGAFHAPSVAADLPMLAGKTP